MGSASSSWAYPFNLSPVWLTVTGQQAEGWFALGLGVVFTQALLRIHAVAQIGLGIQVRRLHRGTL